MKTHSKLGYDMLNGSERPLFKMSASIAYSHHEKWDGTGYPQSLSGDNIPIEGRIVAISDVLDALSSDRVYKKAWPKEKIYNLFLEESGKHFDPFLTKILLDNNSRDK